MLMKKKHVSGIIILLVICLVTFGCGQATPQHEVQELEFTKVTAPFSVNPEEQHGSMGGAGGVLKWIVLTGLDLMSPSSTNQLKKRLKAL